MKILYIYRDYKGRRKRYGKEMESLGHTVIYHYVDKNKRDGISISKIKKHKPDVVWLLNPYYIRKNKVAIKYIRSQKIPIVMYGTLSTDTPFSDWMHIWDKIDLMFIHNKECCDFLQGEGLKAYYMPIGFYPDMYHRSVKAPKYDATFCGNISPKVDRKKDRRCIFIQALREFKTKVYGQAFVGKLRGIPVASYGTHKKELNVYAKTRINLDLPFYYICNKFYKDRSHIRNRFFEVPASGNFLLTLRCEESLAIYGEDTVGYYEDDPESLKEQVARYLKDDDLRKKMAKKAHKLVKSKHTFKHRFKEIFKILKKEL